MTFSEDLVTIVTALLRRISWIRDSVDSRSTIQNLVFIFECKPLGNIVFFRACDRNYGLIRQLARLRGV